MDEAKSMKLDLEVVRIQDAQFGDKTEVKSGTLYINKQEMLNEIMDPYFTSIDVDIARPGESVRIIPVKDVIEPRIKMTPEGGSFPGFFGNYKECGDGTTKVLRGCAVVTTGTIVGFQEGIIDMSGEGAKYCYYSKLINIVLKADVPEGVQPTEHETAIRIMGLKAANYLAKATMDTPFDEMEHYSLPTPSKKLPRIGVIYMVLAQGLLHDNYIYGINAGKLHPTYMHPNEMMDGAIVSGNCVIASDKNTTYDHQNNEEVLRNLFFRIFDG